MNPAPYRYVLPNTSEMNHGGRGSISERLRIAVETGCKLIEIPADLIKNKTEVGLTDLPIGSFLDQRAISLLYRSDPVPTACQVVFHSEPELNLTGCIRWYDPAWVESFARMQVDLAEHLGVTPTAIEIHPGTRPNTTADILAGARKLMCAFAARVGTAPLLLLENRTRHVVSTGSDLLDVWKTVGGPRADFAGHFGIVLDVQQLFTQTVGRSNHSTRFIESLELIPDEALRAFHIHHRHRTPSLDDAIPWRHVFDRIRRLGHEMLINPEVHHRDAVPDAIRFCSDLLDANGAATASRR